ncbi:hypothetical protein LOC67_22590 [Stieleria sp. JC731]|uniref:hypothetical protein n=1 Tax=Stieleria sp. JC731 TaxID=2894195 RepID=UPI001E391DEE|nr:hypothetical protein [Stieleria sp. JC731]MCC9603348.1 hypothetical protein [Stieleria sp. JC731]
MRYRIDNHENLEQFLIRALSELPQAVDEYLTEYPNREARAQRIQVRIADTIEFYLAGGVAFKRMILCAGGIGCFAQLFPTVDCSEEMELIDDADREEHDVICTLMRIVDHAKTKDVCVMLKEREWKLCVVLAETLELRTISIP